MSSTTPNAADDESLPVSATSNHWETIGRELLRAKLEHLSEDVIRDSFRKAAARIDDGEHLRQSDIWAMRSALERAEQAIKLAARASPEATPRPDLWEYLDEGARQAYIDVVKQREN